MRKNINLHILNEELKQFLLLEDRESKNLKMARNVVKKYKPNATSEQAANIVNTIRTEIPNVRLLNCKFIPGVTQMVMKGEVNGNESKLNDTLKLISNGHADEYDYYLNNETAENLINRFSREVTDSFDNDVNIHNNTTFKENGRYTIVRILNPQDAFEYSNYVDWCITSTEEGDNYDESELDTDYYGDIYFDPYENPEMTSGYDMYMNYTDGGTGVFYFCLRDDYKKVKRVEGEGCPLDDYGLSMIATSVDSEGKCNTITCRWNHDNGGNDSIMTPMELSKIIGRNYYKTFKPLTKKEIYDKGIIPFSDVEQLLKNGKNWKSIFKNIKRTGTTNIVSVSLNEKFNFFNVDENRLLSNQWLYSVGDFVNGLGLVNPQYSTVNYIREDGSFLFDEPFNGYGTSFKNGYAVISTKKQRNNNSFNYTKICHIIDTDGNIVNKEPVEGLYSVEPRDGYFLCHCDWGGKKIIDENGEEKLKDLKILEINRSEKSGYNIIEVEENGTNKYALVTPDYRIFQNKFFTSYNSFTLFDNFVAVKDANDNKYHLYGYDEKLISDLVFDEIGYIGSFSEKPLVNVKLDDKENLFNYQNLSLVFNDWPDRILYDNSFTAFCVKFGNKWFITDDKGRRVGDYTFDNVKKMDNFSLFPLMVERGYMFNLLNKNLTLLPIWFNKISKFRYLNNICVGYYNNIPYSINWKTCKMHKYTKEELESDEKYDDQLRYERMIEHGE